MDDEDDRPVPGEIEVPDVGLPEQTRKEARRRYRRLLRQGANLSWRDLPVTRYRQRLGASLEVGRRFRGSVAQSMSAMVLAREGLDDACSSCDERADPATNAAMEYARRRMRTSSGANDPQPVSESDNELSEETDLEVTEEKCNEDDDECFQEEDEAEEVSDDEETEEPEKTPSERREEQEDEEQEDPDAAEREMVAYMDETEDIRSDDEEEKENIIKAIKEAREVMTIEEEDNELHRRKLEELTKLDKEMAEESKDDEKKNDEKTEGEKKSSEKKDDGDAAAEALKGAVLPASGQFKLA